jgi:tRNA dimethylallyltransferase
MQIYKGMNILTSKPSAAVRKKVKHHLVDFLPLKKDYNVSEYRKTALEEVKKILKAGQIPLFVGGTGLYMSILVDGIFEIKADDPGLREKLFRQAQLHGNALLHKKLSEVDPSAALKIHPNDTRRIVRALEVFKVTGRRISDLQKMRIGLRDEYDVRMFCLDVDREELYSRINSRVDAMFKKGIVNEVKRASKRSLSRTAAAAIGLHEIGQYLQGKLDLDEAKELMKQNTRNYARRQLTWFRKDKRIEWIPVRKGDTAASVSAKIEKRLR